MVLLADHLKNIEENLVRLSELQKEQLYPPATDRQLTQFTKEYQIIPLEYQEFLMHHNGWRDFWNGYHLIGCFGFEKEISYIKQQIWDSYQIACQDYQVNTNYNEEVRNWEMRTVQYYLPQYFIFGTDMKNHLLFFNHHNISKEGLCEVILWHKDKGVIASFESFHHFIEYVSESVRS